MRFLYYLNTFYGFICLLCFNPRTKNPIQCPINFIFPLPPDPAWPLVTHTASGCELGVVPTWHQVSSTCHFLFFPVSLSLTLSVFFFFFPTFLWAAINLAANKAPTALLVYLPHWEKGCISERCKSMMPFTLAAKVKRWMGKHNGNKC